MTIQALMQHIIVVIDVCRKLHWVGPRYAAYETEVANEMLQISTFFLQPESPAHVLASLLVPPVNPEIEVIEPVKILSIKVSKPKTSFLPR